MKNKKILIGILVSVLIVIVVAVFIFMVSKNKKPKTNLEPIQDVKGLSKLVDKLYEGEGELYPTLNTQEIDLSDAQNVKYLTGLENGEELQYLVVSEPMMSGQAYSLILAKVKDGVSANSVAKKMSENIDTRKWICVSAEKLYATNSGDIVFLVMSSDEMAKPIYEKFKSLAGTVEQEYVKTEEIPDFSEDEFVQ